MPLSKTDEQQISAFLASIIRGDAKLGFGALPMLKLYGVAQTEHVSMPDLIVMDAGSTGLIMNALKKRARELPPSVLKQMEQILLVAHS